MPSPDLPLSDAHFRLLVERVKDYAIYFLDKDGVIRTWNEGGTKLKGYDADEIVGKSFSEFFTPEASEGGLPKALLARALREGSVEDVGWRVRKDGSRFWASATITAVIDHEGQHIGFAKVTRDLTDSAYRAFVEATNNIVWGTDGSGEPNTDSPSWRAFTGQSEREWRGGHAWDPVHVDDRPALTSAWARARESKHAFECEFRLRRSDGEYVWMTARAVPFKNPDGSVREWFGVTADISARKHAEAELKSALAWWTTTLTSIGDAVVATDRRGHVRFLNPVAEHLLGVDQASAAGKPLTDVFHIVNETTRRPVLNPVDKVLEEGVIVGLANHTVLLRPDGVDVPIDDSAAPIKGADGSLDGVVLVFRDVTKEKAASARRDFLARAGEELMRSTSYRESLATVARLAVPVLADWCAVELREPGPIMSEQVAVAHVDPEKVRTALALNRRYPPDQNAATGVPHVIRTGEAELYAVVPQALLEKGAVDDEHLQMIRELKLHSAIVVPLRGRERVLGAITFVYAESGREYGELDLAFAEDLADRAALVIERRKLEEEAQAANRTKDEFLATISHELRTPLQAMLGWATMLKRGSARDPKKAVEAILRNASTQARLIDDILDVSRIISGKLRLSLRRVDMPVVIQSALDIVRPTADARKVELRTKVGPDLGAIEGDPDRLQQVVWNLVSNAVKFTGSGGKVDVVATREGSTLKIEVKDTGRGIARENLSSIFERFRQVDGSSTRERGGLGLGLAIVHYLVEAHGGRVVADSPGLGHGATFTVTLPAPPLSKTVVEAAVTPVPGFESLSGVHVLVVDDDDDTREIICDILIGAGAHVERASSVAQALATFERATPHVVVTDLGMPVEDGFSLVSRIRAMPPEKGGDVPAVALTAYARSEDVRKSEEAGFQMHITKPVDPDALVRAVRNVAAPDWRAE